MKPPKFHVGQAVVCVDMKPQHRRLMADEAAPKENRVYHVRGNVLMESKYWCIRLEEIVNTPKVWADGYNESAFNEARFAPVETLSNEALAELLEEIFTPVHA
jgi:hypothetical protein